MKLTLTPVSLIVPSTQPHLRKRQMPTVESSGVEDGTKNAGIITCKCWVFNNVDYPHLATKFIEGDDFDNEIDDLDPEGRFSLIFPGTKWCGAGNVADNADDLGPSKVTDKCCRDHDFCPDIIPAGETRYNLTNDAFYTRLNCKCDEQFRQCLYAAKTKSANAIGKIYFNALGTKCYREDYPVTGCTRKGGWLNSKCLEHSYDTNGKRLYQWFDVPNY